MDPVGTPLQAPEREQPVSVVTKFLSRHIRAAIAAVALLLVGTLWMTTFALLDADRSDEISLAFKANANLARALEEHTSRTLRSVDQVVSFLKYQAQKGGPALAMRDLVGSGFNVLDSNLVLIVGMTNEHGDVTWASAPFTPLNIADRAYFKAHVDIDPGQLHIGAPLIGRISGKKSIIMSRRITRPDGSFGGIVYASVDPGYFSSFYQQVDLGQMSEVILVGRDGIVRARQSGEDASVGQDISNTPLLRQASEQEAGNLVTTGEIDGVVRYFSYRNVHGYPFVVGVGTAETEVLDEHNRRSRTYYAVAGVVSAAIVLSAWLVIALILRRRQSAHARLRADFEIRESEGRRAAIVDSAMDAIITVDDEQRIVIFNRAAERVFRCPAAEAIGQSLDRFIPERMRGGHRAHIESYGRTGKSMRDMTAVKSLPALRSDGEEFPVEASISKDVHGGKNFYTVILRDISARKRAEASLQEAERFSHATLDALDLHIAVIDGSGRIVAVNEAWREFGRANGVVAASISEGANYLEACDKAATGGDDVAAEAARLIRAVARSERDTATIEYPCHSPEVQRWFTMTASRFAGDGPMRVVVKHQNITERKIREESLRRFRTAMDATDDAIFLFDVVRWRYVDCNVAFCRMLGYTRAEIGELVPEAIVPFSREAIARHFRTLIDGGSDNLPAEVLYRRKDGSQVPVEVERRSLHSGTGPLIVGVARDIRARLGAERTIMTNAVQQGLIAALGQKALATTDVGELLDHAADVVGEGLIVAFFEVLKLDATGTSLVRTAGTGWEREWLANPRPVAAGPGTMERFTLDTREPVLIEDFRLEARFALSQIAVAHGIRSGVQVLIGGTVGPYGVLGAYSRNVRQFSPESVAFLQSVANILAAAIDRTKFEERAAYLAQFDAVTKLPNRSLFRDRLAQILTIARQNPWSVGVVVIDLDQFKTVNDTYGHLTGDKILTMVARRLETCAETADSVGHLGGDQFAIVLKQLESPEASGAIVGRVRDALTAPFDVDGQVVHLTARFGIALYPGDAANPAELIDRAELAMHRAKEQEPGAIQFYTEAINSRVAQRSALTRELRRALERDEFELHYQPQISLHTGRVVGVEALIRWQHPERGLVAPAEFIALAEETGLIIPIGTWVLRTACAQAAAWHRAGRQKLYVSVNVSTAQLRQSGFASTVRAALEEFELDPQGLDLELTETGIMENTELFIREMGALRSLGVSISVDDFGTGYSSLAYLKRLPVGTIKIDRSFIRDIVVDPGDAAIVRAIIAMASQLKLKVVAEGVETEEQANFLRRSRCDIAQGYLFGKPVAAAALNDMLDRKGFEPLIPATAGAENSLLLVDDEENNLRALRRVFRSEGYQVHTAASARDAFEILANAPIGVIVSDQRMPGMSGTEFLSRVKAMYPETVRIVLSGYTDLATVTSAINEGAIYKFLTKPWDDEALRQDIRTAFQIHADRQTPG